MSLLNAFDFSVFADCDTLILSDAFPPFADGGAELSLNACLAELSPALRRKAVVVTFSGRVSELTLSHQGELRVLHAPAPAGWPDHNLFFVEYEKRLARSPLGERNRGRVKRLQRFVDSESRANAIQAYREARTHPRGGILTDFLLEARDVRYRLVEKIASRMAQRRILLSDNTRSILLGGELLERGLGFEASIAVVRDNRFHCARTTQSRFAKGKICQTCAFQCAPEDTSEAGVPVRQESLRLTQNKRTQALRQFSKVIVTSHELARHVGPVLGTPEKMKRIPNSVEAPEKVRLWTKDVEQSGYSQLLIIGMLNENKGQLQFIQNCADWIRENDDVVIRFCGRGERIEQAIRKHAAEFGIAQQIQFLGYQSREDVYKEIRRSKLVLAPTIWPEPFGRVPLEAGISGRAVIAFGVGGLNESIIHGKTGLLVRPGDFRGFERAMERLLNDPNERLDIEQAAVDWISSVYSPARTSRAFISEVFGSEALGAIQNIRADELGQLSDKADYDKDC